MRSSRLSKAIAAAIVLLTLGYLYAPVVLVVLFSFNGGSSTSPPLDGLSLRWYEVLREDPEFQTALTNSLTVAAATSITSLLAGTMAALAVRRSGPRFGAAYTALVVLPLVVPGLFLGVALLSFISEVGVDPSRTVVYVGHVLVTLPIVFVVVSTRLRRLDLSMVEAARDLGANAVQAFVKVVLPILAPAMVGAALLVIALSLDEFLISAFVNGGDTTLPVLIFSRLRQGIDPSVNAIASLILGLSVLAALVASRFINAKDLFR